MVVIFSVCLANKGTRPPQMYEPKMHTSMDSSGTSLDLTEGTCTAFPRPTYMDFGGQGRAGGREGREIRRNVSYIDPRRV